MTGRHARGDQPEDPTREAVVRTAARLLIMKFDQAVINAEGADSAALWAYLPDNWIHMAEQLARVLVQEGERAAQERHARAVEGEIEFVCPYCQSRYFQLTYSPVRRATGVPPYRVVCARCQGGAAITESGPADGSHVHRWPSGE